MKMKKIFLIILLAVFPLEIQAQAYAEESAGAAVQLPSSSDEVRTEDSSLAEEYIFPVIPPEFIFYGGYRFVSDKGSPTADEYEYLHSSPLFGGDVRYFNFPHRFHLNADFVNKNDYYGDIGYAFKDTVVFRGINRTLYHNLDHLQLIDERPGDGRFEVKVKDSDKDYGVRVGMNNLFLRFKTPDFPLHVYLEGGLVERSGTQQQRVLLGTASSSSSGTRNSMSRDVDFKTKTLTIGANSHLGPVEIDISHGEKRFTVGDDDVLYGSYNAVTSGTPPVTSRAAGVYPNSLIPEIKSSTNTIKLHTSFTGGIVASATLSKIERENEDSGAKVDTLIGAGELSLIASPQLAFFIRYRYRDNDVDNPGHVRITDISNPANTYLYEVKESISSTTNTVTGIVRYRMVSGILFKGEYTYEHIDWRNVSEWGKAVSDTAYTFPDNTTKQTASLSADLRLMKGLQLKLRYTHKDIDNPAYNIDPDKSDEGRISISWMPVPKINTLLSYSITKEKRWDIEGVGEHADDRKVLRDRLFGSVTFLILNDLSLTTHYSYMHNKTEQDIQVGGGPTGIMDSMVPNKIFAHSYGIDLNYSPKNTVSLAAGMNYTLSSGRFYPSDSGLLNPSIADFSALRTKETVVYASGEYRFNRGYALGMQYKYINLDDDIHNRYDDVKDGSANMVFLTLSKKW